MVSPVLEKELHQHLEQLPLSQQRQVLDFARALITSRPRGRPGRLLLQFAGTMTNEEAKEMLEAIEEGCGKVDANDW